MNGKSAKKARKLAKIIGSSKHMNATESESYITLKSQWLNMTHEQKKVVSDSRKAAQKAKNL